VCGSDTMKSNVFGENNAFLCPFPWLSIQFILNKQYKFTHHINYS